MSEPLKPFRIYVVEDSPRIQRILGAAIEQAGAELAGCSDEAQTAISDVFVLQPDLILIDISLASGSGFDVLRALQDHSLAPGASKVVLTNYAYAEYEDFSTRLGADRFFDKSLEMAQVVEFIRRLVEARRRAPARSAHELACSAKELVSIA